ncbi:hypothetical protein Bbelb_094050 [Branchiostoma belcheri]|nr:hypothetical protein Bbelb_094050 [Branchiostoma belcheri]
MVTRTTRQIAWMPDWPWEQPVIQASLCRPWEQPVIQASLCRPWEQPVIQASLCRPWEQPVIQASLCRPWEQPVIQASLCRPWEQPVIQASLCRPGNSLHLFLQAASPNYGRFMESLCVCPNSEFNGNEHGHYVHQGADNTPHHIHGYYLSTVSSLHTTRWLNRDRGDSSWSLSSETPITLVQNSLFMARGKFKVRLVEKILNSHVPFSLTAGPTHFDDVRTPEQVVGNTVAPRACRLPSVQLSSLAAQYMQLDRPSSAEKDMKWLNPRQPSEPRTSVWP